MAIWVIGEDLIFRTKIETAAGALGLSVHTTADAVPPPALTHEAWAVVLVDLNRSTGDPIAVVEAARRQAPSARIIGYGSHVQAELMTAALHAGCTLVLPRSAFVQRLPDLLLGA